MITIEDNSAPVWVTLAGALNTTVECSDAAGLAAAQASAPVANDNCSGYTLAKISGTFVAGTGCAQEGTYTNTWIATDGCGNTSTVYTQVITIEDNTAPVWVTLTNALNATLECSDASGLAAAQVLAPVANDNCSGYTLAKTSGAFVAGSGCAQEGTYTNTWIATDGCGNASTVYTQVITIEDNTAPVIGSVSSIGTCFESEALAEEDAVAAVTNVTSDACGGILIYTATTVGTCSAVITVTVTDPCGNSATHTFNTRIDGQGPTMIKGTIASCYLTQSAAQSAAIAATTATDNCLGTVAPFTASTSGTCPATITVTALDGCGNSSSVVYENVCIDNTPPVITTPASNMNVECSSTLQAQFDAWVSNHGGAIASGTVIWSTIPAVPTLTGGCSGGSTVTFVASDNCGNSSTTSATFSYDDDTAPTASNPATLNLTCINAIPAPDPNVVVGESDNCDASLTVTFFARTEMGTGCPASPKVVVDTYIVTDDCMNSVTVSHTINAVDNVVPTFTKPIDVTIFVDVDCEYNDSPAVTGDVLNEQDNCSTGLNATYISVATAGVGFQNKFKVTRTWTLTDNCGNSASTQIQIITVKDVIVPTITGCPSNFSLSGIMINPENCGASHGTQNTLTIDDNCTGEVLTYALSGATIGSGNGNVPSSQILNEGVTTVTYTVTDAVGNTAACSYSITVNCLNISGRIKWEHDQTKGVKNATVKLSQGVNQLGSDLSDNLGDYSLFIPAAGIYKVTPVKNINRLNGVTAADATRITQHINNSPPLANQYQKVAADVNHNGIISQQDANTITGAIAGNPVALAAFNVFWRFVPTNYMMPATSLLVVPAFPEFRNVTVGAIDVNGQDFLGMKIGDVEAVWADPLMISNLPPLVWMVPDQTLIAGQEVELSFAASNFNNLTAYQMALDFDPMQLQFVGFQSLGAIPMNAIDNFGAYNANLGELRNVWSVSNSTTLTDGTQVFRAKFKVLVGGQKLSEVLKLDESEIPCQAYSEALVPTNMKLVFTESVGTNMLHDLGKAQLQLLQNRPNPFTDATTIGFILPEACEAHIRILDISGRELASYDRKYTAGYHELDFRMENAVSYGMLFCELVTPQGKRTIKMMTAK